MKHWYETGCCSCQSRPPPSAIGPALAVCSNPASQFLCSFRIYPCVSPPRSKDAICTLFWKLLVASRVATTKIEIHRQPGAGDQRYVFRHSHGAGPATLLDPGARWHNRERLGMTDPLSEMSNLKIRSRENAESTRRVTALANLDSPAPGFHVATDGDPVAVRSPLDCVSIAVCRSPRGRPLAQGLFVASPGWCYCSRTYRGTAIQALPSKTRPVAVDLSSYDVCRVSYCVDDSQSCH